MTDDNTTDGTEQPETVLRWFGPHQRQHRIRTSKIPGSAHWHILKDSRYPLSGEWERDWATEANTKPDFHSLEGATERSENTRD